MGHYKCRCWRWRLGWPGPLTKCMLSCDGSVIVSWSFDIFLPERTETWSLGATESESWIGNFNVKAWKPTQECDCFPEYLTFFSWTYTNLEFRRHRKWIGNFNWKTTKHKLHKIWRSLKFCKNSGKQAQPLYTIMLMIARYLVLILTYVWFVVC